MAFLYSLDDDAGGAFTVDPNTGTLTVKSPSYVGVGQAFRITWRAVDTTGAQPPFSRTELIGVTAGAPKLGALSLLTLSATAGSLFASAINGQTAGSTITAVSSDGAALVVSGGVVSGTFSGAGSPTVTLTETLAGAIGSPFTSTASVAVASAPIVIPVLSPLTLSSASATAGTAFSATITGKTAGSTIAATSSDGTTLTVPGSTVSGTFSAAGTPTISLVETLAGATGSPRTSTSQVTVAAAPVTPANSNVDFSSAANSGFLAAIGA